MIPTKPGVSRRRIVLSGLATLLFTSCAGSTDTEPDESLDDGEARLTRIPANDRKTAGLVEGLLLDGNDFYSAELYGQIVVYNVWGSWCAPCRKEAPVLARVARENADLGVTFVGLNVRDSDDGARAFERRFEMPYPSVRSADSPFAIMELDKKLRATYVPATVLVDRQGRIAARMLGEITYSTLAGLIEDLQNEPSPTPAK